MRLLSHPATLLLLGCILPADSIAQRTWCSCPGGFRLQPGLVTYTGNSGREIVTRIEVDERDPGHSCEAAWIGYSEVRVDGTPYDFHLERKQFKTIREEKCGESPDRFVSRQKTYHFVFDQDSQPLHTIEPVGEQRDQQLDLVLPGARTNANVWSSISGKDPPSSPPRANKGGDSPSPEFGRTAWVLARKNITGHYVGMVRDVDQREKVIPLNKTRAIPAGRVGQIEASNGSTAIVRFYLGSHTGKLTHGRNTLRQWYDDVGGPYTKTKDDLYTPLRACILEVSLKDIVEVNDYLDGEKTDRT